MSDDLSVDSADIVITANPCVVEIGTSEVDQEQAGSAAAFITERALTDYDLALSTDGVSVLIPREGPRIARRARAGRPSLLKSLGVDYYLQTGRVATSAVLTQVEGLLDGMAQRLDPTEAHLRSAVHADAVYIDLGTATGEVVEVTDYGWWVIEQAPVVFQRSVVTASLPTPERGSSLITGDLWNVVNVIEADKPLLLAWMLAAWLGDRPCPILAFTGQQGAGKSTAARVLVQLTDPSSVPLRRHPKREADWPQVAMSSRVIAIDNVSMIPDWFSDSLCRAVTGDGDVQRVLYSDAELAVYAFRRAIILNGISWGDTRGDLGERLVTCELRPIVRRFAEEDLQVIIAEILPGVLGALLDLLVQVLAVLPRIQVDPLPRMADFARLLASVDEVLGTQGLQRYRDRLEMEARESADNDPVLTAIAYATAGGWRGTAAELAHRIKEAAPEGIAGRDWPRSGGKMGAYLKRVAPVARKAGWTFTDDGVDRSRKVKAWLIEPPSSDVQG